MAHPSQLQFVRLLANNLPQHFEHRRVLEIGSLDINGSIRQFFRDCDYVGLDVASGPGVDIVCEGQKYDAPDESFDVVISCEAMEHNPFWAETLNNMIRVCRPGGLFIMTCATTGRPEHGTARSEPESSPLTVGLGWNYYRNLSEKQIRRRVDLSPLGVHQFWTKWNHYDLLLAGIKGPNISPGWKPAADAVSAWVNEDDKVRAMRYRRVMGKYAGDAWFVAMNRLTDTMVRATSRMERLHRLKP